MKKLLLILAAFVFIISSCNNNKGNKKNSNRENDDYSKNEKINSDDDADSKGWARSDRNKFLRECEESFEEGQEKIAEKICPCVLKKMEREFTTYDDANSPKGETEAEKLALECKDEVMGSDKDSPGGGYTWSKSEDQLWMNDCSTPLIGTVSEEKAKNYCACILVKLKEIYSSYDEMNTKGTQKIGEELGKKCVGELGVGQ